MFNYRSIIEGGLPSALATPIAHYTRIGTLCHFIPVKSGGWGSAWATPVQFLNDRMELSLGLSVLRDVAKQQFMQRFLGHIDILLTSAGRLESDAFQMSFSGNPDELGQWRGYAANGMGCSVVTDTVSVRNAADVAGWVLYDSNEQISFASHVLSELRNETDNNLIQQVLIAAASFMKHDGFRPEMEFRLLKFPLPDEVKFRESGDRLVPYIDYLAGATALPVTKIIIGPGWQLSHLKSADLARNHVVQGIDRLLSARGLHATAIESSRIPYDPK